MSEKSNTPAEQPMPDVPRVPVMHEGEIEALAYKLARKRADYVKHFEQNYDLSREEAIARTRQDVIGDEERRAELAAAPAKEVEWYQIDRVMQFDEGAALAKWEAIKQQARLELDSGQRGAEVMGHDDPWRQAQYIALLGSFAEEWRPRGGVEWTLLEQMAQTYTEWMEWLEHYQWLQKREYRDVELKGYENRGVYSTPRLSAVEYLDRVLGTAERFQQMFFRSLRALRDLRRYAGAITIHNAGPLSVGGNQQVNVGKDG